MTGINFGDLASFVKSSRLTTQIKTDLERLTHEVASGKKSDITKAVSGDFGPLSSIERSLRTLDSYARSLAETSVFMTGVQTSLGAVSDHVSSVVPSFLTAASMGDATTLDVSAQDARARFESVVSALNTHVGGRALFSGSATHQTPLATSTEMLDSIRVDIAGLTDVNDIIAAVDGWFDNVGGGFETTGYGGSATALSDFSLSDTDTTSMTIKADDPSIRELLKGFALAALAGDNAIGGIANQKTLIRTAGERLMSNEGDIARLRAQVGSAEARIEEVQLSNSAQTYAYTAAKSEIVSVDIYEAASQLTQTESQLELAYTITARLSRLNLSDFL